MDMGADFQYGTLVHWQRPLFLIHFLKISAESTCVFRVNAQNN